VPLHPTLWGLLRALSVPLHLFDNHQE
jgi:hypothetical protein